MKQPQSGSKRRVSAICRLVLMLALVKAGCLASLLIPVAEVVEPNLAPITRYAAEGQSLDPSTGVQFAGFNFPIIDDWTPWNSDAPIVPAETTEAKTDTLPLVTHQPVVTTPQVTAQDPMLAQASSSSALTLPRLLGNSVAYGADMTGMPDIILPTPNINATAPSYSAPDVVRPDEAAPPPSPAPSIAPYLSRDSAEQKQAEINRREQELMALQQQMEARMSELQTLETRLQGMLQDATSTYDDKYSQLVSMYASMKPRVAAQALTSMDERIAVRILAGMKSKESGEILSYMDPGYAARLSELLSKMEL